MQTVEQIVLTAGSDNQIASIQCVVCHNVTALSCQAVGRADHAVESSSHKVMPSHTAQIAEHVIFLMHTLW